MKSRCHIFVQRGDGGSSEAGPRAPAGRASSGLALLLGRSHQDLVHAHVLRLGDRVHDLARDVIRLERGLHLLPDAIERLARQRMGHVVAKLGLHDPRLDHGHAYVRVQDLLAKRV